jgi:hypothetical protein
MSKMETFEKLVAKVFSVDEEAGENLIDFIENNQWAEKPLLTDELISSFNFSHTDQGAIYWFKIHNKILIGDGYE